jgi:UDP-N-acetylmuramoylalanine--D-glutamate ligase
MKKKGLVIGAGRSGTAAASFLARQNWEVILSDLEKPSSFKEPSEKIVYHWGKQTEELLQEVSLVVTSPGISLEIPIIQTALKKGIEVIGELELFSRNCSLPILAVTGTNGKTTTTTLLAKMMEKSGKPIILGGNIGRALSEEADYLPKEGWVVLEVSSYQLETTKSFRPHIAGILNLTPDHLERHKTFENYQKMKEKIFANQTSADILLLNQEDLLVKEMAQRACSDVCMFDALMPVERGIWGDESGLYHNLHGTIMEILSWKDTSLVGLHNRENIAMAAGMALSAGISEASIRETVMNFSAVEHRIEWIRSLDGVDYYNDSKATNPDSVIKALESFERPIVWLAGGYDKGSDLVEMMKVAKKKAFYSIFFGRAGGRFFKEAEEMGLTNGIQVDLLQDALAEAKKIARRDDIVLLSPACSSFDQFTSYEERGRFFKEWTGELK